MTSKMLGLMLSGVLLALVPACSPSVLAISEDDQGAIYAAVARQLYTVDHTFGDDPPNWPVIYLLRATDDRAGDPRLTEARSSLLAESVQTAVVSALGDLPAEFIWIDDRREVIDERIMGVIGGGALVTLGNIYLQGDGSVQVPASVYFASTGAGGTTYIVKRIDGIWRVTGNTGVRWTS